MAGALAESDAITPGNVDFEIVIDEILSAVGAAPLSMHHAPAAPADHQVCSTGW